MGTPNISGDYTIDLNLIGVDAGKVKITNTTFTGGCGDKAVIKVAARGGDSDEDASDIQGGDATLDKLTITGCTFNDDPAANADVNIGTDSKKDSGGLDDGETFAKNTTGVLRWRSLATRRLWELLYKGWFRLYTTTSADGSFVAKLQPAGRKEICKKWGMAPLKGVHALSLCIVRHATYIAQSKPIIRRIKITILHTKKRAFLTMSDSIQQLLLG